MRTINGKQTIPLNKGRTRELAKAVFGDEKLKDLLTVGVTFVVDALVIQKLPEFDSINQGCANSFNGPIQVTVEEVVPTYGVHISLEVIATEGPMTVALVRKVAMEHYETGGDSVIECWSDEEIQEWIDGTGPWGEFGMRGTMEELLKMFELVHEVREDIRNA